MQKIVEYTLSYVSKINLPEVEMLSFNQVWIRKAYSKGVPLLCIKNREKYDLNVSGCELSWAELVFLFVTHVVRGDLFK